MVDRKPNVIGTAIMGAIYWGMLFYWLRDDRSKSTLVGI